MVLKKVGKSYVYLTKVKCTVCMICEDMDISLLLVQHKKISYYSSFVNIIHHSQCIHFSIKSQ